jgi:hydrogenase maturation protease
MKKKIEPCRGQTIADRRRMADHESINRPTLVLGIGNVIMSDDGIGVHVVRHLEKNYCFTPDIHCMDGGTLGLDILPYLEGVEQLLVVDAIDAGKEAGTCLRLRGEDLPVALATKTSSHQVGVKDLLATAELLGYTPRELALVGIQPVSVEIGTELTPAVAGSLALAVGMVLEELAAWGVRAEPRT